jgi:flagellar motor switch protein FliM
VDAAIHLSLGGKPDIPEFVKVREATALDAAVIDVFLDAIWAELNRMWASCEMVAKYKTEVPGSRLAKVFPESEELMTFTYGIKIEKIEGKLQIALPSAVAGVLLREMERKDVGRAASPEARQMLCERLATTQHVAYLRLPQFRMSMAQLLNLEPGSIVSSGLPESTMAQFSIRGGPVWNSPLARRGVRLVAQIGE